MKRNVAGPGESDHMDDSQFLTAGCRSLCPHLCVKETEEIHWGMNSAIIYSLRKLGEYTQKSEAEQNNHPWNTGGGKAGNTLKTICGNKYNDSAENEND